MCSENYRRALTVLLAALVSCVHPPAPAPSAAEVAPIIDRSRPKERIAALPVLAALEAVDAVYRLLPDRRVLLAVRDIYLLHTGQAASVDVDFRGGVWEVRCANHLAGRLPELPQFGESLAMLSSWSHALGAPPAAPLPPTVAADAGRLVESFSPPSLIAAMRLLSRTAGSRPLGVDVLRRAARAAVDLNVQMTDFYGVGDAAAARALALVAMARDGDPRFGDEEATLMADEMGYGVEAGEMVSHLPAESVARIATGIAPARRDASAASARLAYLSARQIIIYASGNERIESIAPFMGRMHVRALPLLLRNHDFGNAVAAAHCVEALVVDDVTGAGFADNVVSSGGTAAWLEEAQTAIPAAKGAPGALASQYESASTKYARDAASRLLGSDAIRGFYDAVFYSALDTEFGFYLSTFGEPKATNEFLQSIGTTSSQPGNDVRAAMRTAAANRFEGGRGVQAQSIVGWNHIDGTSRARALQALNAARGSDKDIRNAAAAMFAVLDVRPVQMLSAGRIALSITEDPLRRDRYMGTALQRSLNVAEYGTRAWFYYLTGDIAALRLLARQRWASGPDRALATLYVGKLGDTAFSSRNFEALLAESYDGYSVYAGWLNHRHEWVTKERAARRWLAANAGHNRIEDAFYAASLGNALENQGRFDEAWKIVEPYIEVWSGNIVEEAVSLLQRRGKAEEANALGRQMIERYPGARSLSAFAVVLWREKRWQDAAALFDPKLARYARLEWKENVPEAFASEFERSDAVTVSSATDALLDAGVDASDLLMDIPEALRNQGRADLAFAAAERVCRRHPLKQSDSAAAYEHMVAYTMLVSARGDSAAIDWLRSQTPDEAVQQLAMVLYQRREFDALFAVASPRPLARKSIELQVYLVAALTHLRAAADDPRVVALRSDVAAQTIDPNSLQAVTRYILGMMDEKSFIAWGKSPGQRCTVEFFIGLKSASMGDYDRALRAVLAASCGAFRSVPQDWADGLLVKWDEQHLTWSEVAQHGVL